MISDILIYSLGLFFLYGIHILVRHLWEELVASPLKDLPGPPNDSLIWGNLQQIFKADNSVLHEKWVEEYGPTIRYKAFFGANRLYTTDTKALNHVLMNHYDYQKPEMARWDLSQILGDASAKRSIQIEALFLDPRISVDLDWKREFLLGETRLIENYRYTVPYKPYTSTVITEIQTLPFQVIAWIPNECGGVGCLKPVWSPESWERNLEEKTVKFLRVRIGIEILKFCLNSGPRAGTVRV